MKVCHDAIRPDVVQQRGEGQLFDVKDANSGEICVGT